MTRIVIILIIVIFNSCGNPIKITNEYITNDLWNDDYNNAIEIQRMKIIDSTLDIFAPDFRHEPNYWNIADRLQVDTTYVCWYNGLNASDLNRPRLKGKVFFSRHNGWNWYLNGIEKPTIGNLKRKTWYKFSRLAMNTKFYKYVFVDSIGETHVFSVNLTNY